MAERGGRHPEGAYVNSVKEDTEAKGLLFAATELCVYVSFNDGEQWQPLQNNMPVTSVRDIVVHGDDLAVATHGRGFWVLDQMTPLRQIAAQGSTIVTAGAYLFKPGETFAIRAGGMNGTPLPHEEPQEENPPSGVVAYYWLKSAAARPLKLELLDPAGAVRACAASDTPVRPVNTETLNVQAIWEQPAQPPPRRPECIASPWAGLRDAGAAAASADAAALRRPRWWTLARLRQRPERRRPRERRRPAAGVVDAAGAAAVAVAVADVGTRRGRLAARPVQRTAHGRRSDIYPAGYGAARPARRAERRGGRDWRRPIGGPMCGELPSPRDAGHTRRYLIGQRPGGLDDADCEKAGSLANGTNSGRGKFKPARRFSLTAQNRCEGLASKSTGSSGATCWNG